MTRLGVEARAHARKFLAAVRDDAARAARVLVAAWRARVPEDELEAPICFLRADRDGAHFSFELPARELAIQAAGEVTAIEAHGADRFATAERAASALFADLRTSGEADGDAPAEAGPILVGGFGFADEAPSSERWSGFPSLRFWLPERLVTRVGGRTWCTAAIRVGPDADLDRTLTALESRLCARSAASPEAAMPGAAAPSFGVSADRTPDAYAATVARALEAIHEGELEKIVVARACTLRGASDFDLARLLRSLRAQHPACFVFAVGRRGATFAGASPERLLRRTGPRVQASVLAGSAPRGRTPEEDERLGRALSECKKEQAEHAIVRRAVCDALAPVCASINAPEAPALLRLDGIQHLHTPVEARLRDRDTKLLALAERLHPTPAVGGAPRDAALAWLAANESLERGWYAGAVGWVAASGDGELAVALRSALLRGDAATLFAGAGVVAGSTPAGELAETRLKLRALLSGLLEI